jgi:hypothetical protein
VWRWWRRALYDGVPPGQFMDSSGKIEPMANSIWTRDDVMRDLMRSDRVTFYRPGFPGPVTGTIFFWETDLERLWFWLRQERNWQNVFPDWESIGAAAEDEIVGRSASRPTVAAERRAEKDLRDRCAALRDAQSKAPGAVDWPKAVDWKAEAQKKFDITGRSALRAWTTVATEFPQLATPKGKKKNRRSG